MRIKNIIKKNLLGFVIGGIIFGTITTVFATSIAASTLAYTTNVNNSVATVNDAVVDLYKRVYEYPIDCFNGVCGKVSYRYWNDGFSDTTYQSNELPTNNYATVALLASAFDSAYTGIYPNDYHFADRPSYIRSILIDGNVVGHQACLWYNNREFCFSNKYWAGTIGTSNVNAGTQTMIKLQRDMEQALGITIDDENCYSNPYDAYCFAGDFYCYVTDGGYDSCYGDDSYCNVSREGSAVCNGG